MATNGDNSTSKPVSVWETFSKKVTIAGLEELFSEREWLIRFLFAIGLFFAACLTIYSSFGVAQDFLRERNPWEIDFRDNDEVLFPNITICTTANTNITAAKEILYLPKDVEDELKRKGIDRKKFVEEAASKFDTSYLPRAYNLSYERLIDKVMTETGNKLFSNDSYVYKLIRAVSQKCDQTLSNCEFNGQSIDCCRETTFAVGDGILCYGIPTSKKVSIRATKPFEYNANVKMDWRHIPFFQAENDAYDGFLVLVGQPFSQTANKPVAVSPGWHANLRLARITYRRDLKNCVRRSNLPSLSYLPYYDEEGKNCVTDMMLKDLQEQLQCTLSIANYFPNASSACNLRQIKVGVASANGQYDDSILKTAEKMGKDAADFVKRSMMKLENYWQSMGKICKPICDRWLYEPIVGYSELRNEFGSANEINKRISWSKITVSIPSSYYEIHKEGQKSTIYILLCNIGGVFGVYAGLSMITIIQLIVYGFLTFRSMKKKRKENTEKRKKSINGRRRFIRVAPAPVRVESTTV